MSRGTLLIIEDDPLQRRLIRQNLEAEDFLVMDVPSGTEALLVMRDFPVDVAVVDYKLEKENGIEVIQKLLEQNPLVTPIMVTAHGNVENAVEAMKKGAYDFISKPIDFENFLLVVRRALERQKLKNEVNQLRSSLEEKFSHKNMIFVSSKMAEVAKLINRAAGSEATVIVSGETGTGKDLVAKTIHFSSRRKNGPFMAVNIPSLPETLVESELFGVEKGAFTGAHERKIGKFEAAAGGTLFLDEVGDLPLQAQVKLLRFLQEREFYRLGSSRPIKADVRIIAATHRDLEQMMKQGDFRQDLFYRLNVIRILVPRLSERREDIAPLIDHFIRKYSRREGKQIGGISSEAMNRLMQYSFPGNIRELENLIERAVVFSEESDITTRDFPIGLLDPDPIGTEEEGGSLSEKVGRLERREIVKALRESGGVKSRAARKLGITERILSYKIKSYGLSEEN